MTDECRGELNTMSSVVYINTDSRHVCVLVTSRDTKNVETNSDIHHATPTAPITFPL